eukprot:Sdes_comp20682_c0_seq8m16182
MAEFKGGSFKGELAFSLAQKRELEREEFERRKEKIALENESHVANFNNKFSSTYESIGDQLINDTVGLVTRDEFARKREKILQEREQILAKAKLDENLKANSKSKKPKKKKLKTSTLSFDFEEDDPGSEKEQQSEEASVPLIKTVKNPAVDTSFLPDKTRELEERRLREELRQEWLRQQEIIKKEEIEITYSYWDGSGHRKTLMAKKGNTIGEFLQKALETLRAEFFELKHASTESVMYIKEDLIIPQVRILFMNSPLFSLPFMHPSPLFSALYFLRFHHQQSSRKKRASL